MLHEIEHNSHHSKNRCTHFKHNYRFRSNHITSNSDIKIRAIDSSQISIDKNQIEKQSQNSDQISNGAQLNEQNHNRKSKTESEREIEHEEREWRRELRS